MGWAIELVVLGRGDDLKLVEHLAMPPRMRRILNYPNYLKIS